MGVEKSKRRVLMINQHFYPHGGPGAHRMAKMATYLPESDWEPVVACVDATPGNSFAFYDPGLEGKDTCEMIRVPLVMPPKRSLWGFVYRVLMYVFPQLLPGGPYLKMKKAAEARIRKGDIDVILASSPVHFSLIIADYLSRKYGVPWVADMRDLPGECSDGRNIFTELRWLMRMQMATCRSASALITVSEPLGDELRSWHPKKPVQIIYNGFDEDNYSDDTEPDKDHFHMVFCGSVAGGTSPVLLFDALDDILESDSSMLDNFSLSFYGSNKKLLSALLRDRSCSRLVKLKRRVSFEESIVAQMNAQALLFLAYPHAQGIMSSKLFEYLGAGRPVLSVPGDGGVTDIVLRETGGGVAGRTADEIKSILSKWISEWRDCGTLKYNGKTEVVSRYTRKHQAGRLGELLDRVHGACGR